MNALKNPNLPEKEVKGVLVDYRTPENIIDRIKCMNIDVYRSQKCSSLYSSVDGHPDMVLCHIMGNFFVCEPNFCEYYKSMFPFVNIIKGDTYIQDTYPQDIAYNIARVGKYAFCKMEYTDRKIIEYLNRFDVKIINVNQGYSKCSICVVDENSIITSDKGIAKSAEKYNIDVLLIKEGHIKLKDLDYGFIGGASGKLSSNKLAVAGNINFHCDSEHIYDFCLKKGVDIISLSNEMLVDIGTIIPIYE